MSVEQKIGMSVPAITLTKIGKIEGSEKVQQFVEKMMEGIENVINDEQREEMEELRPYIANVMFLPFIIAKMIHQNVTLKEALKNSEKDIQEIILNVTELYDIFMHDAKFMDDFEKMWSEMVKAISSHDLSNKSKESMCRIELVGTMELIVKIANTGLFAVVNKICESEEMKKVLKNVLEDPIKEVVSDILKKKQVREFIDEEEYLESLDKVESFINSYKTTVPLENVLTIVLKKAINEDMTFGDAVKSFNEDELYLMAIDRISIYNNFEQIKELVQKMFVVEFDFFEKL